MSMGKSSQRKPETASFFLAGSPMHGLSRSDEAQNILLVTPGGFLDALDQMSAAAERLEMPTDADALTYANVDLTETIKVFEQYGIRFLTPDEIRAEMLEYPLQQRF